MQREAEASQATPSVIAVSPDAFYVPYDGVVSGEVIVDVPSAGEYELTLSAQREAHVPSGPDEFSASEVVFSRVIDREGRAAVPFFVSPGRMLIGALRLKAELARVGSNAVEAGAWSESVRVGVRKRVDLSGEWFVEKIRPFGYGVGHVKDPFVPDSPPERIALPGRFKRTSLTSEFRDWVSVSRKTRRAGARSDSCSGTSRTSRSPGRCPTTSRRRASCRSR
jgi:hypothetical protein